MKLYLSIVITLSLLCLSCTAGAAEEHVWDFRDHGTAGQWKAVDASIGTGPSNSLIIRGKDTFWFVSPPKLHIPARVSHVEFELKAPATYLMGYLIMRGTDNRTWQEEFQLGIPDRFNTYRINMQKGNIGDSPVDSFAFAFGGLDEVELNYVKCYEPSFVQGAGILWAEFWNASYAKATTVNFIDMPFVGKLSFLALLYACVVLAMACAVIAFGAVNVIALRKAMIISFILAGMLFALRMDYGWYVMWRLDRSTLSHRNYEERVSLVDATGTYEFAGMVRKSIPPDASVRIECGNLTEKMKYYLLPLKESARGRYIIICGDSGITYDPGGKALKRGEAVFADHALLMSSPRKDFSLYRIEEAKPQ